MKFLLFAQVLLMGLAAPAAAQRTSRPSLRALDQKNGFRDVVFGTPLADLRSMRLVETNRLGQVFQRPTDALREGGAALSSLGYGFYKGQLASVLLVTKGLANSRALLQALQASYGPGVEQTGFRARGYVYYLWKGRVATMFYLEDPGHDAWVTISNEALSRAFKRDPAAAEFAK